MNIHTKSKTRKLWSDEETLAGIPHIVIVEVTRTGRKWDKEGVAVTPAELVKICQAHGIVVPPVERAALRGEG